MPHILIKYFNLNATVLSPLILRTLKCGSENHFPSSVSLSYIWIPYPQSLRSNNLILFVYFQVLHERNPFPLLNLKSGVQTPYLFVPFQTVLPTEPTNTHKATTLVNLQFNLFFLTEKHNKFLERRRVIHFSF